MSIRQGAFLRDRLKLSYFTLFLTTLKMQCFPSLCQFSILLYISFYVFIFLTHFYQINVLLFLVLTLNSAFS